MADYGGPNILGRVIVLLFLIAAIVGGGILWFDYLNVIDAKTVLAPIYSRIPFIGGARTQPPETPEGAPLSLEDERFAVRLEALDLRNAELEKQEQDIQNRWNELEQMSQELELRQKALEEQENSLTAQAAEAETKERNAEYNARLLTGMDPERAVGIIAAMDDQLVIDVFRKTEEIAQAEGTASIVSYWLSLLDPVRAAELQRKMAARPQSLN
ncbi:MAG: flagellar protein FlbB [Treponema sp.]|jgi:flagellar protein FlbB|nr:flagellar protein FlbB [Treponema sp.]